MRAGLGRPVMVLILALVLVGVLGVLAGVPPTPAADDPSSRSPGRAGTLALHTWLGDLGFQVHRISSEFDLSGTDVLLSVDPRNGFGAEEAGRVMAHLAGGGDAVIALNGIAGVPLVSRLLDRLHITAREQTGSGVAVPAQPIDSGGRVDRLRIGAAAVLGGPQEVVPLLTAREQVVAVAVREPRGGRAYVIGSAVPFSNDGLRRDDASEFVLTLLERARGGRIAFDEFHHGEAGARTGAAAILAGPIGFAAGLWALLILIHLATAGRRVGRPLPARDPARVPSATTYMRAMSALHRRSSRRGGVADRYARELKARVARVSGVEPHLDDDKFRAALAARGDPRSRATGDLLARARMLAAAEPSERELLDLARDVEADERLWAASL
ncbi:MAG: DUF4350 domain-containing protein [Candidatus Dormibacteria bacterium]